MPTLLDVHAMPRGARSRTRKLRDAFVRGYLRQHPDAAHVVVDLAHGFDHLPVFDEWDIETKFEIFYGEGKLDDEMAARWNALTALTDQLHSADVIVVSSPMWNFSVPWMLKRWIDAVVQPKLTFEVKDGTFHGLLGGRTGVILATRDSTYAPGTPHAVLDHQLPYLRQVFGVMGIAPIHTVIAEPLSYHGHEKAQQVLETAMGEAEQLGATL